MKSEIVEINSPLIQSKDLEEHVILWCCRTTNKNNICVKSSTLHDITKTTIIIISILILLIGVAVAAPFIGMKISYDMYSDTYDMNTGCRKGVIFCSQTLTCYEGNWISCSFASIALAYAIVIGGPIFIYLIICCIAMIIYCGVLVDLELSRKEVNYESG